MSTDTSMNAERWWHVHIRGALDGEPHTVEALSLARNALAAILLALETHFSLSSGDVQWGIRIPAESLDGIPVVSFTFLGAGDESVQFVTKHASLDEMAHLAQGRYVGTDSRPSASAVHTPDEYQQQCLATWGSADDPLDDQLMHAALGLAGETGELIDRLKKHFFKPGHEIGRADVLDELADVAYYVAIYGHLCGITFDDLFDHLATKLADGHGWMEA